MGNQVYTRKVLGLEEYLIELDKGELDNLSNIPAIKPAIKVLYTAHESKVDLGAIYIDSLPWAEDEEVFLEDGE